MHQPRISATAALALTLVACASPLTLTPLTPIEKTLDCPQIHLAIDRADTVRWLIRDGGGRLESSSDRSTRYALNTLMAPLMIISRSALFMPSPGHEPLNAADGRIRELLQLKRAQGCPPRVTALRGMNDLGLLSKLELVQADIDARRGDEDALFKERTRLLDGLRIVPAPATASEATISPEPAKDDRPASTDQIP